MADDSRKLEKRLVELGESLASPPSSVDELYALLDQIDGVLSTVEQSPSQTMLSALRPLMTALSAKDFLRHSDLDVKAAVASCISEITRITAPEAPYDDDNMKEIFQMIVETFEGLDQTASRSFQKRVSILETVAKVRSCVVMLDLECDALILEMFHNFLKTIRTYHSENVFTCMETVMTLVIEESEDISTELLSIILDTLRNNKEDVLSIAQRLAEKVMHNCASKIKSCLPSLVRSKDAPLSEYHKVVASICQENDMLDRFEANAPCEVVADASKFSESTYSDEPPQVSGKLEHEKACPENVGTVVDTLPIAAVSNGINPMGNGDSIKQPAFPKPKPEHSFCNGQSENVVSDHADSEVLESTAVKPDDITDSKKEEVQKTNSSTLLTDMAGHSQVECRKGAPDGTSSRDCLIKETDSLEVDDTSTNELKPTVSSEAERDIELQHLSGSDNPTAVALPSFSGVLRKSGRPRKGRTPGTKANARRGNVNAKADLPSSRSVQKDLSVVNHTHDQVMTSKVDEGEREPEDADDLKTPVSLLSDSMVKSRKRRPHGSKAIAKRGDVDGVADVSASRSVQKDPAIENHAHDEMMTSKVDESERKPEDADDLKTPGSLLSDSTVKPRKRRPAGLIAKRGDVGGGTVVSTSRSVQKDLAVENHARDEMMTSKVDESERKPKDADDLKTPGSLLGDSTVKSRKRRQPGSKAIAKRGDVDGIADVSSSRSVQKDPAVENHARDEIMTSKVDESKKKPKDADDAKMLSSLPNDSAVKSRRGRPSGSKSNAKRGYDSEADARSSRAVQKDPWVKNHPHHEIPTSKGDGSEKESEDVDDVKMPVDFPSDLSMKTNRAGKKERFKKKAVAQESSGRKKSSAKHGKDEEGIRKDVDEELNLKESSSSRSASRSSRVQSGDKAYVNDSVVPKRRRKRSMEIEAISETPYHKKEVDESLVGAKIKVWWPDDEMFYDGIVDSYDPHTKKHKVVYADDDVEVLLLKDEHWKYLEGDTEKERGERKAKGVTSQTPRAKKRKANSNFTPEQAKSLEQSKSAAEASGKSSPRPKGRPRKGKLSHDDSIETSNKSKGKSASNDKAKTPRSSRKLMDVAETEPEVKTPTASGTREESGKKSKDSTPKISDKLKDELSTSGKKIKSETPKAITKLKVYSSKGRGKSVDDTATKDSTPRAESRSKATDEVAKNRSPKTGSDSKAGIVYGKGKRKVEENENEGPLSDGNAATGGKKRRVK